MNIHFSSTQLIRCILRFLILMMEQFAQLARRLTNIVIIFIIMVKLSEKFGIRSEIMIRIIVKSTVLTPNIVEQNEHVVHLVNSLWQTNGQKNVT